MTCSTESTANEKHLSFAFMNWKPVSYLDKEGKSQGIMVETVREVLEKRLHLKVDYRQFPWKRAQNNVETGKIDFLITVVTPQRLGYAVQNSIPFYKTRLALYTYDKHPKINEIKMIKNVNDILRLDLTAVTNLGNGWHKDNIETKGVKTFFAPSDQSLLSVLKRKRVDFMIDSEISVDEIIKSPEFKGKIIKINTFATIDFHLLMSKRSQHINLIPKIDAALQAALNDDSIHLIEYKYHQN